MRKHNYDKAAIEKVIFWIKNKEKVVLKKLAGCTLATELRLPSGTEEPALSSS